MLKAKRERISRKLGIAKFSLEENQRRAGQGKETYQNVEIELWKANLDSKFYRER